MSQTITPPPTELSNPQLRPSSAKVAIAPPGFFSGEFVQETLALTRRLFIQLQRRPSTLIAGIIQPLMWLVLFGALFQNVPQGLFGESAN